MSTRYLSWLCHEPDKAQEFYWHRSTTAVNAMDLDELVEWALKYQIDDIAKGFEYYENKIGQLEIIINEDRLRNYVQDAMFEDYLQSEDWEND